MALYIAQKILEADFTYKKIFSAKLYKKYQDDVDVILVSEGKEDLIER